MFSRHDKNPPKKPHLDRLPYWNLTDNDFVFAEPRAPWGIGRNECYGGSCFKSSFKDQLSDMSHGCVFIGVRANYFKAID